MVKAAELNNLIKKKGKSSMSKLPAWELIWWSFDAPKTHFHGLVKRLFVPLGLMIVLTLLVLNFGKATYTTSDKAVLLLFFLYAAVYQVNIFSGVQQVILDLPERSSLIRFGLVELRTAVWIVIVYAGLLATFLWFAVSGVLVVGLDFMDNLENLDEITTLSEQLAILAIFGVGVWVYLWVFLRTVPMMAIIAVRNKIAIRACWKLTEGSSLRIFVTLFFLSLVAGLIVTPANVFYKLSQHSDWMFNVATPIYVLANLVILVMFAAASSFIYLDRMKEKV